jgi:hypothetical protein
MVYILHNLKTDRIHPKGIVSRFFIPNIGTHPFKDGYRIIMN